MARFVRVSEETLRKLSEGEAKYVEEPRLKFGRWVLKEKVGEFIGCKSEATREG